jgi:hypothetical protein
MAEKDIRLKPEQVRYENDFLTEPVSVEGGTTVENARILPTDEELETRPPEFEATKPPAERRHG